MSEIPDDIKKAAAEAHAAFATSSDTRNLGEIIVSAILAERERCAKIADHFSQSSVHSKWPDDARSAGYYVGGDIANAIRGDA